MSDPACCILAVCCPPGSDRQREALAKALEAAELDAGAAATHRTYADWIVDRFDLAPKGSLEALKGEVARMARGNPK